MLTESNRKPKIELYITRYSKKLRTRITEPGEPSYEVTIGGEAWKGGKGVKYKQHILKKACELQGHMNDHIITLLAECINKSGIVT